MGVSVKLSDVDFQGLQLGPGQFPCPHLLMLIGVPGSGKSTLASQIAAQTAGKIVCCDQIRGELFGHEAIQGSWGRVWGRVVQEWQQGIHQRQLVIYDATNARCRYRRQLIAYGRSLGFRRVGGLWLDVPLEVCLHRNRQRDRQVDELVITRMYRALEACPPQSRDGWDYLYQIKNL